MQKCVQHVELRVRDWSADGHGAGERIVCSYLIDTATDCRFGRTVFIDQPGLRSIDAPKSEALIIQRLAANHQRASALLHLFSRKAVVEHLHVSGRQLYQREIFAALQISARFSTSRCPGVKITGRPISNWG